MSTLPTLPTGLLNERALLVALKISEWSNRRNDRRASAKVTRTERAAPGSVRVSKTLLPGPPPEVARLVEIRNRARSSHYANTLPWDRARWALLPAANFLSYADTMRRLGTEWETAVRALVAAFPRLVEEAKAEFSALGLLFDPADYPSSPDELLGRYGFAVEYEALPQTSDLRISLPKAEIVRIQADLERRLQSNFEAAVRGAWERLHDAVSKLHERTADPDAVFRDTLVGNLHDLVDVLTRLNVTGDEGLERLRKKVADKLTQEDPETLRQDPEKRKRVADEAAQILKDMEEIFKKGGGS